MKIRKFILFTLIYLLFFTCSLLPQNRDSWQQPRRIMDSLMIKPGMIIGEVGAGSGYFTLKLADRLNGNGYIYANDIDESALKKIDRQCRTENIHNVKTILGIEDDPLFPVDTLDLVIMVYAFHHLQKSVLYLENLTKYLKPGKPVVIVERDPDRYGNDHHFMKKELILNKINSAKYTLGKIYTFLERDNIYVCYTFVSD